ncbi:MAG: serine hydrolase domain-containing protein [Stackebrandtia sp.]
MTASRRPTRLKAVGLAIAALAALTACGSPPADAPAPPIASPPSDVGELTKTDVNSWLDGSVPASLERAGIAGAAVTVVKDGEILTSRGYGNADTGTDGDEKVRPVDPAKTMFRIGSVAKLFTDTAAMQLVQDGKLDLDTDVNKYLDFTMPQKFDRKITLRYLMTHTAGFEEAIDDLLSFEGKSPNLRDVVSVDPPEQIYEPGTVPAYSNYSNALIGYIVERASGMPFEKYIEENIYEPAGMSSSSFRQPLPEDMAGNMSNGYTTDSEPARPFEIVKAFPAGSMAATPTDMAKFMLAHLGELDEERSLLDPKTRQLMQEPALGSDTLGGLAKGPRMTLGFFDESRNGQRIIGHGGDTDYFHSHLQLYPDKRTGIFVTMNSVGHNGYDTHELRRSITTGFADRYFPADGGDQGGDRETVPIDTAREHAAMAEGAYDSSRTFRSTFMATVDLASRTRVAARDDGTIVVNPGPASVHPIVYEEVEPWLWQEVGGQRTLAMRAEDGDVTAIGFESAFSMLPVDDSRGTGLALSVLIISTVIMIVTLLTLLAGGIRRRVRKLPARDPAGRVARVATRVAVGCALLAIAGWLVTIVSIMNYADIPPASIRVIQGLQLIGALGVIPAAVAVVDTIRRREWRRAAGAAFPAVALAGVAWFAVTFMLLAPSITY